MFRLSALQRRPDGHAETRSRGGKKQIWRRGRWGFAEDAEKDLRANARNKKGHYARNYAINLCAPCVSTASSALSLSSTPRLRGSA